MTPCDQKLLDVNCEIQLKQKTITSLELEIQRYYEEQTGLRYKIKILQNEIKELESGDTTDL